jgi:hypothetical protein
MVYSLNEILSNNNTVVLDEPQGYYAKWNRTISKGYILHNDIYMTFSKT